MNSRLIIKRVGIAIMAIISCLVFSSCLATEVEHPDYFGFDTSEFTIVVEENKHGGFHGDGTYNLILDCSENVEKSKDIVKDWKPLPLSESLQVAECN